MHLCNHLSAFLSANPNMHFEWQYITPGELGRSLSISSTHSHPFGKATCRCFGEGSSLKTFSDVA